MASSRPPAAIDALRQLLGPAHLLTGGLALLSASSSKKPRPRLLLATDAFALAEPEAQGALREASAMLGATDEIEISGGRSAVFLEAYTTLQGLDVMRALGVFLGSGPSFGATIAPRFEGARALDSAVDPLWRALRKEMAVRMHALLSSGTMLLLPTTPSIAPLRFLRDAHAERFYQAALTLSSVAGLAGLPVVTLPIAVLNGCPLGLSVLAGPGEDEALLAAATSDLTTFPT